MDGAREEHCPAIDNVQSIQNEMDPNVTLGGANYLCKKSLSVEQAEACESTDPGYSLRLDRDGTIALAC